MEPVYSHDDREVSAAWPTFSDCITRALLFAGELAGSVTQEVGSADKFRDLRSAATVGTGAGGLMWAGAGTDDRTGWCGRRICAVWQEHGTRPSRSRAAGKFRAFIVELRIL